MSALQLGSGLPAGDGAGVPEADHRPLTARRHSRLRSSAPLLIVFAIELVFTLALVISHRGLLGHDGFQYFTLQYYFLNNAATTGETAQWMPLLTHGSVSNWWYGVQAGMVQSAMLALGRTSAALVGTNFLPIFHFGIFFDEMVFLLGVFLLSRRYFISNLTITFVAITALGSTIWFSQPWYGLHFFYALPLIFHFIHRLLETGHWRYLLLAGNLFAIQGCGSLPYLFPMSALVIFSYTVFYLGFFWKDARRQIEVLLGTWWRAVIPLLFIALSFYCVNGMLSNGTDQIANYSIGRTLQGKSESLGWFMTYGTNSNYRWVELLTRVSPALDYTLYVGFLPLVLAAIAWTVRPTRYLLVVACTTLIVLLIANASPVAAVFYYAWPMMKYFRHLTTASTIVRMFLCFLAGFGFEAIVVHDGATRDADFRGRYALGAALLGLAAVWLFTVWRSDVVRGYSALTAAGFLPQDGRTLEPAYARPVVLQAFLLCFGASLLLLLRSRGRFGGKWGAIAIIVYQAFDIYSYKVGLAQFRTIALTPPQYRVCELQPMPYTPRRTPVDYHHHYRGRYVPQNGVIDRALAYWYGGAVYWTADSFMFTDPPVNIGRTDHWLWSFDDFLRTYYREPIRDLSRKPRAYNGWYPMHFPDVAGARKLAGVTEDKIQFFTRAFAIPNDRILSRILQWPGFNADILLVSAEKGDRPAPGVPIAAHDRVPRPYRVLHYDADDIAIRVDNAGKGEWLYYADCWHPFWRAWVNGAEVPIHKASLAYKAVPLAQGTNTVRFRFHSPKTALFMDILNWNGFLWVVLFLCFLFWETSGEREVQPNALL